MAETVENILTYSEIESYIDNLKPCTLEDIGTRSWFEFHKKLMLLSQQSIFEISTTSEESVKEWFISLQKIPILIFEAIQINIWKQKVFPLLVKLNGEPENTFLLYSVFYHEDIVVSLLENILFHSDTMESIGNNALDLIDYAVHNVIGFLSVKNEETEENQETPKSCLDEIKKKRDEFDLDIGLKCVSILRYLAEFSDYLPACAISRMLCTHDVPYILTSVIVSQPWKKYEQGQLKVYNGKWEKVESDEEDKICKFEAQAWIGLRELLLNPKSAGYYEITGFRMSQLTKLQKYLQESLIDQISPLIELRRWLAYLSISPPTSNNQRHIKVEVMPQLRTCLNQKYSKQWEKLAKKQSKHFFSKNIDHVIQVAQVLNDAYDIEKLQTVSGKNCETCNKIASKRCSKCKITWYCSRECQVKGWLNHKEICR